MHTDIIVVSITHHSRFYWLLYITWGKIAKKLSRNNPSINVDISRRIISVENKQSQLKSFTFYFYM